jgi:peptide/nickel transport system substrate-binding protein
MIAKFIAARARPDVSERQQEEHMLKTHRRGDARHVLALGAAALMVTTAACGSSAGGSGPSGGSASGQASADQKPPASAILDVAAADAVTTWDPIKSFSTEVAYIANIYEPLLYAESAKADGEVTFKPALATSWSHSADGRTWTFKLRSGITFHDGEPLDSAAVKASLEAAAKDGGASFIWADLDTINAPDPSTVVITMKHPQPVDLIASSEYGAYIVAPNALAAEQKDSKYFEKGIDAGTGPYTLASYTAGKQIVLKKYPQYWGGWSGPHYDTINISVTSEAIVQQQQLQSGQAQLADSVPLENVNGFKDSFDVYANPSTFSYVGFFNTLRPPLDDPKVRQALSYAVPYDDIVTVGASGFGTQSHGAVPAGIFPYSDQVTQYHQDLAKAKDLLAAAGHPGGGFTLNLTYAAENQSEARFAPLIKDAFAKVGVTVNLKGILFNQQWAQAKSDPKNAQDMFLLLYWPTYSDAGSDNLHSLFHSATPPYFNLSYWNDKTYDSLVDKALDVTQTDRGQAESLYTQAQQRLVDQAPGLFFYDQKAVLVTAKSVQGFEYNINYPFVTFYYPLHP